MVQGFKGVKGVKGSRVQSGLLTTRGTECAADEPRRHTATQRRLGFGFAPRWEGHEPVTVFAS